MENVIGLSITALPIATAYNLQLHAMRQQLFFGMPCQCLTLDDFGFSDQNRVT
jgi:hypothetical protein